MSHRVFGRDLFLPVSHWIAERRGEDIHFTDVQQGLIDLGLSAPNGPLSDELRELEALGMIKRKARTERGIPYRFSRSGLWEVVEHSAALAARWNRGRERRGRGA